MALAESGQQLVLRPVALPGHRLDPGRAVDVCDGLQIRGGRHAEIQHVRVVEAAVIDLRDVLEPAAGSDRAVRLTLLDVVEQLTGAVAKRLGYQRAVPERPRPQLPAPLDPGDDRPLRDRIRKLAVVQRASGPGCRVRLAIPVELGAAVDVPFDPWISRQGVQRVKRMTKRGTGVVRTRG